MPLSPGSRLGPYEVSALVGAGGMGEVYRARDAKLNREVALKVLPDSVARDPDRLARFRREAQVLAALNHPNIAQIHGFEDSGATHALVMELVEGSTLDELIRTNVEVRSSNAELLQWVVPIARQVIDALEAAHEQGIIHRDLKPANVKIRDDGTVKVLDFGLAKITEVTEGYGGTERRGTEVTEGSGGTERRGTEGWSLENSPTLTARATQMGMILGTAAYMAPEQARGRIVDRRADIWAFGVLLYEMLAGRRAFEGDDISITLANVLKDDVNWDALPAGLPASILRLLRRCLEKDPKRRLAAIADARLELDEAASAVEVAPSTTGTSRVGGKERWAWASLAGLATVAAITVAITSSSSREVDPLIARFTILPPGEGQFSGAPPRFGLSPDGRFLVFAANSNAGSADQLWLRQLDSTDVRPIPGTESGTNGLMPQSPFWSPDGRHLAFFFQSDAAGAVGESRLRTVDLQGGSVQVVCELPSNNAGGSWNADGVMLVSSQGTKGIQRVPASGGVPAPVTTLDASRKEVAHLFPQFLPDGRHFIYQVLTTDRNNLATFVGSLDSPEPRMLIQTDHARFAAPDLLLYVRDGNLLAQTMDMDALQLTGEPTVVATGIDARAANGRAGFAVSDNGVLAYHSNPDVESKPGAPNRQLTWVDRTGKPLGMLGALTSASTLRLSPEAAHVALVDIQIGVGSGAITGSLWVTDLGRNVRAPLTSSATLVLGPTWSADSTRLLFASRTGGNLVIMERAASGATPASPVYQETGHNVTPLDESADGRLVVFSRGQAGRRSLHILSRQDGTATTYLASEFDLPQASLSSDGKWLAYASNESGAYEIVVQPFPDPSRGKWQISTNGGLAPRWRRDGRELFYVDGEQQLTAVPISVTRDFTPGIPVRLFSLPVRAPRNPTGGAYVYDADADGQRFLVSIPNTSSRTIPLTVTTNWTSVLKKE